MADELDYLAIATLILCITFLCHHLYSVGKCFADIPSKTLFSEGIGAANRMRLALAITAWAVVCYSGSLYLLEWRSTVLGHLLATTCTFLSMWALAQVSLLAEMAKRFKHLMIVHTEFVAITRIPSIPTEDHVERLLRRSQYATDNISHAAYEDLAVLTKDLAERDVKLCSSPLEIVFARERAQAKFCSTNHPTD